MTEQELITSMQALTGDAQTVLANLVLFAEQDTTVTFTLSNGQTVTIPSLPKQISAYATQQAADRLAFLQNFGGLPSSQSVTRDSASRLSSVSSTFANNYQTIQAFTRNVQTGQIEAVTVTCKDPSGTTIWTLNKTINRSGGRYSGV